MSDRRASDRAAADQRDDIPSIETHDDAPSAVSIARPGPTIDAAERLRAWLAWFGVARLVITIVAVVIVAAGGFWLVRSPSPTAEAVLPVATASIEPNATLPPPSTSPTVPMTTIPSAITVHVAGSVAVPGVYELDVGDRVHDALARAGGATDDADLDALNLAQPLADGQRLYVPVVGAHDHAALPVLTPGSAADPGDELRGGSDEPMGPVDVNTADASTLDALPGVGPATAQAIVDDRERNGPFVSVDDLERVPGIGPAKLAALRDLVTV